jgi:hypothetical protein
LDAAASAKLFVAFLGPTAGCLTGAEEGAGAAVLAGRAFVGGRICAFCRDSFGLFAGLRVMIFAAFHALEVGATVPLGVVKPLTLSGGPFFVGPLDNQEVADRPQFEDLSLVFWDLDQDQGEGLFGAGGNHPGHLDWCQALVHQVGLDVVEVDLDGHRSEHGTECFLLGESERVEGGGSAHGNRRGTPD